MKKFCTLFVIFLILSFSFNVASAANSDELVRIPDPNLAFQLRKALGLGPTAGISKRAMSTLTLLDASMDEVEEFDFPTRDLTGLEHATALEVLHLSQHHDIRDLSPLSGLRNLRVLALGDNAIGDLSPLSGLRGLRELHLGGNQIRDISPLAGLTQLSNLGLYRNRIQDISPLSSLRKLRTLYLADNQIRDISPLAELTQLRYMGFLGLGNNQIRDISPLASLTELKGLDLVDNQIRDISPLVGLVKLERLSLAGNPVEDVSPLAALTSLVEVDVEIPNQVRAGGVIADRHLAGTVRRALGLTNTEPISKRKLQGLKLLNLAHNDQVRSLKGLEHATQLEALFVNRSQINGDISVIANLTQLKRLALGDSQIRDISALANLRQLTELNLQGNEISDLTPLSKLTKLERLWLVYNRIADLTPLANLKRLTALGLYSNAIRDVSPLGGLLNLQTLSLEGNPIEDASALANLPNLRDVDITIPQPPVERVWSHPPIFWMERSDGRLYVQTFRGVEALASGIDHATGLAVDTTAIYWTEQTGIDAGKVKRVSLDDLKVQTLAKLRSVPNGIAVDSVGEKLYWANSRGRIQRANLNGKHIRAIIANLDDPSNITLDIANGKLYWTERSKQIRCASFDGSAVKDIARSRGKIGDIAVFADKLYWTEQTHEKRGQIRCVDLKSLRISTLAKLPNIPISIAVDTGVQRLYWTNSRGAILSANLKGRNRKVLSTGPRTLVGIALGSRPMPAGIPAAPISVETPPEETILFSNYPNPFNPETWIPYQLSKPASVTLTIYSVNGQVVRELALGHQRPGTYQNRDRAAYWDGRNAVGEPVASGVYFYTLTAGDFTATRKMLIKK